MESPHCKIEDIRRAAERIAPHLPQTPVLCPQLLARDLGVEVALKCENLQLGGAFKLRGATNALLGRDRETLRSGVATQSSGNHALAVSFAAQLVGVPAYIAMPHTARRPKVELVERFGGTIRYCEPTEAARRAAVNQLLNETGALLVHPFEDPFVIAGQGTVALELLAQFPAPDLLLVPLGGGGLLSGCLIAVKAFSPSTRVIGVEPEGADDTVRSLRAGARTPLAAPHSIADGLLQTVGELPFSIIRQLVDDVVTVSEEEIAEAMRVIWQSAKLVVEPSGAVAFAALLTGKATAPRTAVVLSGGNIECPWE